MQISIKKQLVIFILFYHVLQITKKSSYSLVRYFLSFTFTSVSCVSKYYIVVYVCIRAMYTLSLVFLGVWAPPCESESTKIKEKVELQGKKVIKLGDRIVNTFFPDGSDERVTWLFLQKTNVYIVKMSLSCLLF